MSNKFPNLLLMQPEVRLLQSIAGRK